MALGQGESFPALKAALIGPLTSETTGDEVTKKSRTNRWSGASESLL